VTIDADILVVGAGIAGASLAAELAPYARVVIIEAESQPGYHSTGRSAAFWSESYGGPQVKPLTTASGSFLSAPPLAFADEPFLRPRGALHLAEPGREAALDQMLAEFAGTGLRLEWVEPAELQRVVPGIRPGWSAVAEPSCADIDVAALHGAYLRAARAGGVTLVVGAPLHSVSRDGPWTVHAGSDVFTADMVVNAAGAWADEVARRCGEPPLGIQPYRRTIAQLRIDPPAPASLPLVIDAAGRFYFKPEAGGRIWLSPHDETPCPPCDSAAEEEDVARAIHELGAVTDWRVERVEHRWAGLRSFAPDRLPVYGFGRRAGFFWCAGQGGFGIQTAPAAAKLAAALLLGTSADPLVAEIDPAPYLAGRFAN